MSINSFSMGYISRYQKSFNLVSKKFARYITHPHPSFSPDNRWVLFTSDKEGMPALYLAEV
ncbi:oligogalacturonate lyase family protein [Raoultella planticola]|uniref:oligogalacturonate lyase family protein n=1 Tax=Raoultella planticola TaxID=575 RepID=UPI002B4120EC|nr:oligogalacturonate lyase family protein [Raoultella planticola]